MLNVKKSRFCRGHIPNTGQHPDAHALLSLHMATAPMQPLTSPDLRSFDGPIANQGQAGSCGALAFGRQLALFLRANGLTENWLFADPRLTYPLAMLQEYAGQEPGIIPPLRDAGVQPALLLKAVQALGFVVWGQDPNFTYPTDDETLNDAKAMLKLVTTPVPPEIATQAYDQSKLQYGLYQGDPTKVADWLEQCFLNRVTATFAMVVDSAYEQNSGEIVTKIDLANALGGHDQCPVAFDAQGNLVVDGSWGYVAGNAGVFTIARDVINNPQVCSDFQIIKAAPLPEGT